MRLGITMPMWGPDGAPLSADYFSDTARRIEDLGFDSIWIPDTINRGYVTVDPLTAAATIATVTSNIEIGTAVLQVGRHHGVDLAQRLITLAMLSDGRFTLGAGAGSTEADFAATGADFGQRFSTLASNLATIRALASGDTIEGVDLHAWPDTRLPIVVGAWAGSRWIQRAATEFDGWMGSAAKTSLTTLRSGLERYRALGGTRAVAANLRVDLTAEATTLDIDGPLDLRCTPHHAAERLRLLADAGFDDAILTVFDHSDGQLERLRALLDDPT